MDKKNVLDLCIMKNDSHFLTVGSKHIKSWTLTGSRLKGTRISWKGAGKAETVLCCSALENSYVVGTGSGKLVLVSGGM